MVDRTNEVALFPAWAWVGRKYSPRLNVMRAAIEALDELTYRLDEVSPQLSWSTKRWRIASTPFRMLRVGVLRRLDNLAKTVSSCEGNEARWVYQFNDACRDAERQLSDIDACLYALQNTESLPEERMRYIEQFVSGRCTLFKILAEIRYLTAAHSQKADWNHEWQHVGPGANSLNHPVAVRTICLSKLYEELLEIDGRLRSIVDDYYERPSAIDGGLLGKDGLKPNIDETIVGAYRLIRMRIYSDDSPLRRNEDVWDAFDEQKDEFVEFYNAALNGLEIYKEMLELHRANRDRVGWQPQGAEMECIRQEKYICLAERSKCISAISDFHGKLSAMLTIL
jgi:hypothetical protein